MLPGVSGRMVHPPLMNKAYVAEIGDHESEKTLHLISSTLTTPESGGIKPLDQKIGTLFAWSGGLVSHEGRRNDWVIGELKGSRGVRNAVSTLNLSGLNSLLIYP